MRGEVIGRQIASPLEGSSRRSRGTGGRRNQAHLYCVLGHLSWYLEGMLIDTASSDVRGFMFESSTSVCSLKLMSRRLEKTESRRCTMSSPIMSVLLVSS